MKYEPVDQILDVLGKSFKPSTSGARFGCRVPTIVICGLTSWLLNLSAFAQTSGPDLSVGATFRSYALSGVAEAEVGYGQVVWGNPSTPFYGFIRPRINGSTAGSYNSLDGALEVFPLAFLGVRGGGEAIQNDHKYTPYDCELYRCQGRFYRTYVEGELSLGVGAVFAQGRWRRERWTEPHAQTGDFVDPTSGLVMRGLGDSQTVYYAVTGVNLNPNWALMAALRYAETDPRQFSRMPFGSVRYRNQGWSVALGAGTFQSELKKRDFTVVALLRWEIAPSVALH